MYVILLIEVSFCYILTDMLEYLSLEGALRWEVEDDSLNNVEQYITVIENESELFQCDVFGESQIRTFWYIDNVLQNKKRSYKKDKV